jgi:integrase
MLAAAGVPVNVISAQLGHASLSTTHHYLQLMCPRERMEAIGKVAW